MSKLKDTKVRLQSKLEVIKKINDDPNSLVDSLSDKFLKDLPSEPTAVLFASVITT